MPGKKNSVLLREFENDVFDHATQFLAQFVGGRDSPYMRETFPSPQKAMERALTMTDEYGRGGTVYAVHSQGHFITLDRAEWGFWLERWFVKHPEQTMRRTTLNKLVADANAPRGKRQAIAAQRSRR